MADDAITPNQQRSALRTETPSVEPTRSAERSHRYHVGVIGGGPGALFCAEKLAVAGLGVTLFEAMPSVGRKFLLAGRGGLNLTHSEPMEQLLERYGEARAVLEPALRAFDSTALRAWCEGLEQPTFVGSSGRVFPDAFRATPLLRNWLRRLERLEVDLRTRCRWVGWAKQSHNEKMNTGKPPPILIRNSDGAVVELEFDAIVCALGGASWPSVGSDGTWTAFFEERGVAVNPLRAANCGVQVAWSEHFQTEFPGTPLKNIAMAVGPAASAEPEVALRMHLGEAMVTESGLEGSLIYALGASIAAELDAPTEAFVFCDLLPHLEVSDVEARLAGARPGQSTTTVLRKRLGLPPVAVALLRESIGPAVPRDPHALAVLLKRAAIKIEGFEPLERAISTAGGVSLMEIDEHYMLRRIPGVFVVGEMLDWTAPTGGYLLQGAFSTAAAAAQGVESWLGATITAEASESASTL